MHPIRAGRTGLLAALFAAVLSTAAFAAETARDETTLLVRTSAGALERLKYEGELADGERRALTAESGNPATLSRSGDGMLLELAGERFEVKVPDAALAGIDLDAATAGDAGEDGKRRIVIHRHEDHQDEAAATGEARRETRKVVKLIRKGDATADESASETDLMALAFEGADPEVVLMDGQGPKVVVMRRIVRHDRSTP
jgi:hypothetical protein